MIMIIHIVEKNKNNVATDTLWYINLVLHVII